MTIANPARPDQQQQDPVYSEDVKLFGIRVDVQEVVADADSVRLRLRIECTGKKGDVILMMDVCRLYLLDEAEAIEWQREARWKDATGTLWESLYGQTNVMGLVPEHLDEFPLLLQAGDVWEGWLHTNLPMAPNAAAVVALLGLIMPEKLGAPSFLVTSQKNQLLIALRPLPEIAGLNVFQRAHAWFLRIFRAQLVCFSPYVAGAALSLAAGEVASQIDPGLETPGFFVGFFAGLFVASRLIQSLMFRRIPLK